MAKSFRFAYGSHQLLHVFCSPIPIVVSVSVPPFLFGHAFISPFSLSSCLLFIFSCYTFSTLSHVCLFGRLPCTSFYHSHHSFRFYFSSSILSAFAYLYGARSCAHKCQWYAHIYRLREAAGTTWTKHNRNMCRFNCIGTAERCNSINIFGFISIFAESTFTRFATFPVA